MRVSVRLKQSLWASALVMSLVVTQSPTRAFGQNQFSPGEQPAGSSGNDLLPELNIPTPPAETSASIPFVEFSVPTTSPEATGSLDEAKRALFKARQSLAHGDLDTALAMLNAATKQNVDFTKIGDSPATIQSMIDRQNELAKMAEELNPAYNASAASFLLSQSEALMYYQDFETSEMLISQARKFPVEFNSNIGDPDELLKMIETARKNAAITQRAAQNSRVDAISQPAKGKAEAMKLLSQAQLAMDQEKWNEAKYFVDQAKALKVADTEFAADEMRPWQLELKIQKELSRHAFDPSIIQAGFTGQQSEGVVQAGYDPANDLTKNITVSAIESDGSTDFNSAPKSAHDFYLAGMQAMDNRDTAEAKAFFERAWQNQSQLNGRTRQSLQDQLNRLTMSGAGTKTVDSSMVAQASGTVDLDDGRAQQNALFKKLQSEIFRERASSERLLETNPREALEKMTMIRGRVAQSQLDANSQRPLLTIIDRDLNEMQRYIDQNLPEILNDEANGDRREQVELRRQRRVDVGTQLQKLVDDFNRLVDEQRFSEAQVVARQAADLAPDSELVAILSDKSKLISRLDKIAKNKADKEGGFWNALHNVDEAAVPIDDNFPYQLGDAERWERISNIRLGRQKESQYDSAADRRIWNTLRNERVQGEYRGTLAEAIAQLSQQAGINIVFDELALAAENVQKDRLVDIPIHDPISLRSALQLIIESAGLVFVVENEVIKVTSRDASQSKVVTKTYYIGDLVMPHRAPQNPMQMHFMGPNVGGGTAAGVLNVANNHGGPGSELALAQQLGGNTGGLNYGGNGGPARGTPSFATVGGQPFGGVSEQDFQPLIDLVQNTIQPDTWQDTGQGLGTVEAFVPNLSLIVSQTQEIQDEIQDLLKKLRELNDVQIVVEVRFINLVDDFFERVGVDFDFNLNDNNAAGFDPANSDVFSSSTINGLGLDGTPTGSLDLEFRQNSILDSLQTFGGGTGITPASFGFAILSDIEVFFLVQAAKGDVRSNVTQAPTVTMFNGQSASITDGTQQPFVTSVIPVVGDFAVAHQPVITILPDGTNLNVTAVVSDDRRFVRLQLVPFFSQVTDVETFTFDGSTTTEQTTNSVLDNLLDAVDGTADLADEELETTTEGITVQLPVLSVTSINTVVSVPDGGTVLLGGIKRVSEGRTEQGVPFLSNVPYVNRLFKNVGIGQETSNLMMMVTPRIIIQQEIEEDLVGTISSN